MSEKNLPIKLVLQKATDTQPNKGRGDVKFFGDVTPALQEEMAEEFNNVLAYYEDVFQECDMIPAVGKITVRPEAIAKSHKPNDLCRCCHIIGSEDLNEIYIKVTKKTILDTIEFIKNPPSQRFRANMTAVLNVQPIFPQDKVTNELSEMSQQGKFDSIKTRIKIKVFDFNDEFDNSQIFEYVMRKLAALGLSENHEIITYGNQIKYIKVQVESFEDIKKIAEINGVKNVDFFQEYSLPTCEYTRENLKVLVDTVSDASDVSIGIIDGGISDDNPFLKPYIIDRKCYVGDAYRNPSHATFIASTILYGNMLNEIPASTSRKFRFVDIVAIPNGDSRFGPTDTISEEELMEIIVDAMEEYSASTKIWNLSLGIENKVCNGAMSDLGIFLDYVQDKYKVQIFVSSGNLNQPPFREWPPQGNMGDRDRIISPADSVRAITVGAIALKDSDNSIVKRDEPAPFSRRGPGANYIVKPDVVDYGGNITRSSDFTGIGIKGLDNSGNIIESVGTSYSTPRVVQKFATVYDTMVERDLLLAKAITIHSARMNFRDSLDRNPNNIKYYGFGMPSTNTQDILQCSSDEITLVFRQKIMQGTHLEMVDFPYPKSLIHDGKCFGEIGMTLAYDPILDACYGREYCRTNIDASFGMCYTSKAGMQEFRGCVPLETTWDEKYEKSRVENGFKWSPIKSYYRKISSKVIKAGENWKIRINLTPRNGLVVTAQEFVLIITIRDAQGHDIYSEVVNGLRERGYITNNLETRQQIRQRQ